MSMRSESERPGKVKFRKEIPIQYRWDIDSIYRDTEVWEKDCRKAEKCINKLVKQKDCFTSDDSSLLRCLRLKDQLSELVQKIYTYAHMIKDGENQNSGYQAIFYQASRLLVRTEEGMSFIEPGIMSMDVNKIEEWIKKNKQLKMYRHYLRDIFRKKEHILSHDEEKIIAQAGEIAMVPENSFSMLSYADLKFPKVRDEEHNDISISHGNFISLLRSNNRLFRKNVFKKYYQIYARHRHTFAALLAGNLKKDRFYSHTRKYKNSLEAALFEDDIPVAVYDNLLNAVHKNIPLLQRYIRLKKEFLHLDSFHMYDMYVSLSEEKMCYNYSEAQEIIIQGLAPLGGSYQAIIQEGFRERWVDVYENEGKTSGAYSTGSYRSKPFILLNYQGTLEDIYTLAHEFGHSLHSYYTNRKQPLIYSGYSIFLAEIASTTNEALLTHFLLKRARNRRDKLTILNHFLEQFRTTFFRQAMFAEFERMIHEYDEKGEPLTTEWFSRQYADLNRIYYGRDTVIDQEITMEWARIPHFYYHYYVYQYAIGFAVAIVLSRRILQEGESTIKKYLAFLSKGSSDYPIPILKQAGIDIANGQSLEEAMDLFGELLVQLEDLRE